MHCAACAHYLSSDEANKPRMGLAGYGYCQGAPSVELRARFFRDNSTCWLTPPAFRKASPAGAAP